MISASTPGGSKSIINPLMSDSHPTMVTITDSAPPFQILCARIIANPTATPMMPVNSITAGLLKREVTEYTVACL
jgi:hypothetical protein